MSLDSFSNIINLDNILKGIDKRTTIIRRNIPNKYSLSLLLKELNIIFYPIFDIIYLPQDYMNNSNLGLGFINFIQPLHIILFYNMHEGKKWNKYNSNKICHLEYSNFQGKNNLIKYIYKKLNITNIDNNDKLIKALYINNNKYYRSLFEIPIKFYNHFNNFFPYSLCH